MCAELNNILYNIIILINILPHFISPPCYLSFLLSQYKSRNNYMVQIDGFRGYYQQWLKDMPAKSAADEQAELQTVTDPAVLKTEATDGLTETERSQRAAARRYKFYSKDKKSSATL